MRGDFDQTDGAKDTVVPVMQELEPLLFGKASVADSVGKTRHLPHITVKSASIKADNLLDRLGRVMCS